MQLSLRLLLLVMLMSPVFIAKASASAQSTRAPIRSQNAYPRRRSSLASTSSSSLVSSPKSSLGLEAQYRARNVHCQRGVAVGGSGGNRVVMNISRESDGDAVVILCRGGCEDVCRTIGAIRIRCDLSDWPCKCKCATGPTFRPDIAKCVDSYSECTRDHRRVINRKLVPTSHDVHFLPLPSSTSTSTQFDAALSSPSSLSISSLIDDSSLSSSLSSSLPPIGLTTREPRVSGRRECRVTRAYRDSRLTGGKDDVTMTIGTLPWKFEFFIANRSLNIEWTNNTTDVDSFQGSVITLHYNCFHHDHPPSSLVFKVAGSRIYSVASDVLRQSNKTPSTAGNRLAVGGVRGGIMTSLLNISATPETPAELLTVVNVTTANMTTDSGMTAYEERLEVIITGLCVGVAVLLCLWLACFLIEKQSQSKYMKRGSDKQTVSQTRQYPHDVATVRKTLMEIYDMPMIRVANSDDDEDESESGSGQSSSSNRGRSQQTESEGEEQNSSANISSSDQPTGADSSSSEDTAAPSQKKKSVSLSEPKVHLVVPKEHAPEKFGSWRPVAKAVLGSPGETRSNRFLKTSPPMHPKRSGSLTGRTQSILKKPSNFSAAKSPPAKLRFARGRKSRDESVSIEMNSLGDHHHHHGHSPKKHVKLVSALKTSDSRKQKRTRFKMDEPDDVRRNSNCAGADTVVDLATPTENTIPKQLVMCEVHVETPKQRLLNGAHDAGDDTDDDDEDEVTERTPLKKNVDFVVMDQGLTSKCKVNLSWEDTDGLPCTDV